MKLKNPENPSYPNDSKNVKINTELNPVNLDTESNIREEKETARKNFGSLIDAVTNRYRSPDSTLAKTPEQLKQFVSHNNEILDLCIERGIEKGMTEEELRILQVSAILHDIAKADTPASVVKAKNLPADSESISNLVLAMHHDLAADSVDPLLEKNPEILKHILGEGYSDEDAEKVKNIIKTAIKSHMGPHPGFMDFILDATNKALKEKNVEPIKHPYPEKGDSVSETLLAADMKSLAGRQGREKVLTIRKAVPFFSSQDLALVEKYKEAGIDLKQGEAALLSGFASAEQARDMLRDEGDRGWVNQSIEASKDGTYDFGDDKVTYTEAITKQVRFGARKQ